MTFYALDSFISISSTDQFVDLLILHLHDISGKPCRIHSFSGFFLLLSGHTKFLNIGAIFLFFIFVTGTLNALGDFEKLHIIVLISFEGSYIFCTYFSPISKILQELQALLLLFFMINHCAFQFAILDEYILQLHKLVCGCTNVHLNMHMFIGICIWKNMFTHSCGHNIYRICIYGNSYWHI